MHQKLKNAAEQFMQATIHGVTCKVVEGGPHVQLIKIYHYPYEEDNSPLLAVLGRYEEVQDIRYQRYSSSATLSTGNRLVRVVRKKHIPCSLNVAGYAIKTWYAGEPTECDICREAHVAKNCPFRGKCRKCMQGGHVAPLSLRQSSFLALVTLLGVRHKFHLAPMMLWTSSHVVKLASKLMMLMIKVIVQVPWESYIMAPVTPCNPVAIVLVVMILLVVMP